ncbi:hypothetical protein OROHE_017430 [Orobanche hederae]
MKNPGVLVRLRLGKNQTSRAQAPAAPLEPVLEVKPIMVPIVESSEEPEEQLLNTRKRRRSTKPSVPASVGRPIAALPISEHPLSLEELPPPFAAYLEAHAIARVDNSRGRLYFGRDPDKVTRVRCNNPNCPPMVLDFLVGNFPQEACDVPHYVNRALHNLPRAWTINLDKVARRRSPDAAQALFMLALQTATMAAQVARDSEERLSTARLQAELEAVQKQNVELADKLAELEKNSVEAVKEAERMKAELVEARRFGEVALKEAADREQEANQKAAAEGKATRATEELAAKNVEIDGVTRALADLKGEIEEAKLNPYLNMEQTSEFAYYMAYGDAIRVAKGSRLDVGPLVESFKAYVPLHLLNPTFVFPILDLGAWDQSQLVPTA